MAWQRTDDFDGTPAEQVTFGLDGKAYTLDLGEAEHAKFRALLQRYLTVAVVYAEMPEPPEFAGRFAVAADSPTAKAAGLRILHEVGQTGKEVRAPSGSPDPKAGRAEVPQRAIRAWANQNGFLVGPKGRIPESIITAYHNAQ